MNPDSVGKGLMDLAEDALGQPEFVVGGVTFEKPDGTTVHRSRLTAIERNELPAIGLYPLGEKVTRQTQAPPIVDRVLKFTVEIRFRGDAGDITTDPGCVWARIALFNYAPFRNALYGPGLDEVDIEWAVDGEDHADVMAVRITFNAHYRTKFGDPTKTPFA